MSMDVRMHSLTIYQNAITTISNFVCMQARALLFSVLLFSARGREMQDVHCRRLLEHTNCSEDAEECEEAKADKDGDGNER
jgi:hypothetical protein